MLRKIGKTKAQIDDSARFVELSGCYRFVERGDDLEPYVSRGIALIRRLVPTAGQLHFKVEFDGGLSADDFRIICTHGIRHTGCSVSLPYINVFTNYM